MALGLFSALNFLAKIHRHLNTPEAFVTANGQTKVKDAIKQSPYYAARLAVVDSVKGHDLLDRPNVKGRGLASPPERNLLTVPLYSVRRDLAKSGGANLIGLNLRRSLTYFWQELLHLGIGCAVVSFRVFLLIPQTNPNSFRSVWSYQAYFVAEAFLLLQQRQDVFLKRPVELDSGIGFETYGDTTSKHE
jgi:hypothetical protein